MKKKENNENIPDIEEELGERVLEAYLEKEKAQTEKELAEVQEVLVQMYKKIRSEIELLDREIKSAYEDGNEPLWISLTNKKSLLLQNLYELVRLIKKQPV
jgi:hypothetical protein